MPGENLTRAEAIERSSLIGVDSYLVEVDLTKDSSTFPYTSTVRFTSSKIGSATFIDAITTSVESIELNGQHLDPVTHSDGVRISLPNLQAENTLVVKAHGAFSNSGEGLHRFVDPVDDEVYFYTQFEVPDSRRMFAVFEQPDLKATFEFKIIGASNWKVISNSTTPESVQLENDLARWDFKPTPRISSYITALIAGPYSEWRDELKSSSSDTIPLGVFCRSSLAQYMDADYIFEKTKQGFNYFEGLFDYPYPFEKYDQLWVPDFNAGAMENAGAVTFTESYIFRSAVTDAVKERRVVTILHELAHMWFGDLVTMTWWNDLWLNESFAEYASTLATAEATEWTEAWTTFASLEKSWAYRQDQMPSTHPIVAEINDLEDVQVNFDGITYAKGASVLKQLVAWVGQDAFMKGVGNYFKAHQWGNTELKDLLVELEKESGRDLSEWSSLWLETSGVNTLRPEFETDSDGCFTKFQISQTATSEHFHLRPHRLGVGLFDLSGGKLTRRLGIEIDIAGDLTQVSELIGVRKPDLVLINDQDLAYAKIRLDDDSWKVALNNLSGIEDSLARTLVWSAAWDTTRDAEANPRDFIQLVLDHISGETESTTVTTLLRQLVTTSSLYVRADKRKETAVHVAESLITLAEAAEAGSDNQLQFTKFVAQFASTQKQLDWLDSLTSGDKKLTGLTVDGDLRWELLIGLAVENRADEARIALELKADNTANGQKFAAAARAAFSTETDKQKAWTELTEKTAYSNTLISSASASFGRVSDTELLEDYADKYMLVAQRIWETRTYQIASYLLTNLYPVQLAHQGLADKTRALIDSDFAKSKPAFRRILVENLAGLERGLKVQAKDEEEN
ncbi:MAG: aminopeptidase N [Aquiluna sp.]|nr:aminopeptidase N [Aquiluna sp.]